MNAVEELEEVLILNQVQELADFDPTATADATATQQLLDELLGRFEEDDSPMFSTHTLNHDFCADSDE
jgi:hypothetical protein